jgi:hypothetical protein
VTEEVKSCGICGLRLVEERDGGRKGVVGRDRERERARDCVRVVSMMVLPDERQAHMITYRRIRVSQFGKYIVCEMSEVSGSYLGPKVRNAFPDRPETVLAKLHASRPLQHIFPRAHQGVATGIFTISPRFARALCLQLVKVQ